MSAEPQQPTGQSRFLVPILLTGLSGLPPLSIDMFLPSMSAMAGAIIPYPEKAGLASALMGFIQMMTAGLFVSTFAHLYSAASNPMIVAIAGAGILQLLVRLIMLKPSPESDDTI